MVGQKFIVLLQNHPYLEISELIASEKNAGKKYFETVEGKWMQNIPIPKNIENKIVSCANKQNLDAKIIFSAIDSKYAGEIESRYRDAGYVVVSNSKNYRMHDDVPLLIGEVNPSHLELINEQKKKYKGFIVTNPNCSTIGLVSAIKPLHDKYEIEELYVTTLQAISGAGYPGVASLNIFGNTIPYISGEAEKIETETLKLLGKLDIKTRKVKNAKIKIYAVCNRVPVIDGHSESVIMKLKKKPESIEEIINILEAYSGEPQRLNLNFSPKQAIIYQKNPFRPQVKYDLMAGDGMSVTVGGLHCYKEKIVKMSILSNNVIKGAAGQAISNAELLIKKGYL